MVLYSAPLHYMYTHSSTMQHLDDGCGAFLAQLSVCLDDNLCEVINIGGQEFSKRRIYTQDGLCPRLSDSWDTGQH